SPCSNAGILGANCDWHHCRTMVATIWLCSSRRNIRASYLVGDMSDVRFARIAHPHVSGCVSDPAATRGSMIVREVRMARTIDRARAVLETFAYAARTSPAFLDDVAGDSVWDYFTNAIRAAHGALADRRVLDALGDHVVGRFLELSPTPFGFFAREEQGVFVYDSNQ